MSNDSSFESVGFSGFRLDYLSRGMLLRNQNPGSGPAPHLIALQYLGGVRTSIFLKKSFQNVNNGCGFDRTAGEEERISQESERRPGNHRLRGRRV